MIFRNPETTCISPVAFNGFRKLLHGVVKLVPFFPGSFNGDDGFVVEILGVVGRLVFLLLGVTVMVVFFGCIVVFGVVFGAQLPPFDS